VSEKVGEGAFTPQPPAFRIGSAAVGGGPPRVGTINPVGPVVTVWWFGAGANRYLRADLVPARIREESTRVACWASPDPAFGRAPVLASTSWR